MNDKEIIESLEHISKKLDTLDNESVWTATRDEFSNIQSAITSLIEVINRLSKAE